MYQSVHIKNFRCFEDLQIENLGQVNLIVGRNNAGKSALLEALYLLGSYPFPERVARLSPWRGLDETDWFHRTHSTPPWSYWFRGFDEARVIELGCISHEQKHWSVNFYTYPSVELSETIVAKDSSSRVFHSYYQRPLNRLTQSALLVEANEETSTSFVQRRAYGFVYDRTTGEVEPAVLQEVSSPFLLTELLSAQRGAITMEAIQRFSALVEQRRLGLVIRALQQIEPSAQDVRLVFSKESPLLLCDLGGARPVPLALMGDGMLQMFHLSALIATAQNGVALIDEIENGLHYSVYPALWEVVAETAQAANAQVFATTHSYECIQAAVEVFAKRDPNLLRVHRLERSKGVIRAITYDPDVLETAIEKFFEVR